MHKKTKAFSLKKQGFLILIFVLLLFFKTDNFVLAEETDLELTLDANSTTVPLPKIFKPNIDLSGRGTHKESSWPRELSISETIDTWDKDISWRGIYRLQYNLWQITQLSQDKPAQEKLLANYEAVIKKISDAGGIVIVDIFGTPIGLGKILDKRSPAGDLKAFKEALRPYIQDLSCKKRYNIWYEVWSAPDLGDFFLGRKQEYLNLYKAVAEVIMELESQNKIYIPLGGPAVSWWYQNFDGNNITTPERSLIYELIKFASQYKLPLDFISWHTYSTDPKAERENTHYNKTPTELIRDWTSYFNFDKDIPLIVDEWNYDSGANLLPERQDKAFIAASFIPARIKNMYEAGINYQLFFSLEDFYNVKDNIVRNVGIFSFNHTTPGNEARPKVIYNVFKMLSQLGSEMLAVNPKFEDEFVNIIATKEKERFIIIIANYADPGIFMNYLSRNISTLNEGERNALLEIVKSNTLEKIINKTLELSKLKTNNKIKSLFKKAQELNDKAVKFSNNPRNIKIIFKNLKEDYSYVRYAIDSGCSLNCDFKAAEEKTVTFTDPYQETLILAPYSVNMIILEKKPKVTPQAAADEIQKNTTLAKEGELKISPTEKNVTAVIKSELSVPKENSNTTNNSTK